MAFGNRDPVGHYISKPRRTFMANQGLFGIESLPRACCQLLFLSDVVP
jgi:hypothetical protein